MIVPESINRVSVSEGPGGKKVISIDFNDMDRPTRQKLVALQRKGTPDILEALGERGIRAIEEKIVDGYGVIEEHELKFTVKEAGRR